MKTCSRLVLLAAILLWMACRPAFAQPVLNGYAAVTCYSLDNMGGNTGPVAGLIDVRLAHLQPLNTNWAPPMWHGPASSYWDAKNLGEVFGVTFDLTGNVYVAATIVYGNATPGGPAGSGGIYRLDGTTGAISTFASLPNTGVGLGNITWDPVYNQMFATNFEDGKIYRLSSTGTILSTYDPFGPDAGKAGLAVLGERLWGIGVYNNRVYFGRWNEDAGSPSSVSANEIWSIALDAVGDFTGTPTLEVTVSAFPTMIFSNPVSDISFSTTGRMLASERGQSQSGNFLYPAPHVARLLEYQFSGSWVPTANIFEIGEIGSGGMTGSSSSGGNDYAYASYNQQTETIEGCDESVWSSGDALDFYSPDVVYGFQRLPATGGTVVNSVLVDADGNLVNQDKTQIGDIEIYKHCEIDEGPCDHIQVQAQPSAVGQGCCYDLTISGIPAGAFTSVVANVLTAGTTFTGVIGPTGWNVTNSGTTATWDSAGIIPGGIVTGLHFCISTTAPAPQQIEVILQAADGTICRYVIAINCEPENPQPCFVITEQQVKCEGRGPNGWIYSFSFKVTNYSPFSLPPYNLPAENVVVYAPGMTITPTVTALSPTLAYGQTSGTLNYTLTSPTIQPGDNVCVMVQLHGKKLKYDYQWCCPPEELCFDLPPCAECCDSVDIAIRQHSTKQVGNAGASISSASVNVTPGPITKVQANIMGVSRSRIWCPDPQTGAYVPVASPSSILGLITSASISPVMPVSSGLVPPSGEVVWGTVYSGVNLNPGSINLNLSFPGTSLGWRCLDTLTICVRYTFTDTACRTCDTVVYYSLARCGGIEIGPVDVDVKPVTYAQAVQGEGLTIGEPLYSDVVQGPGLELAMSSLTQGTLSLSHWWQDAVVGTDKVRLVRMHVMPEPGIEITSLTPLLEGQGATIEDHTATIAVDLRERETDQFRVNIDNPTNADFFALRVQFDYVNADEPEVELSSREYVVYGDLNGTGPQGSIDISEADKSTPTLYKLLVTANGNHSANWSSPACFRFTPPDGVRILASGPMPDSSFAEFHVLKSMSKSISMLLQLPSPGEYRKEFVPEQETVALWLVLEGGGNLVDLDWEALNADGSVIGTGRVQLSPTSTVRDGDDYVPGTTINLLDAYPNPAQDRVTTRFNLAHTGKVSVALFDVSGREIARLVENESLSAGSHEYDLNIKSLSSGVYYVRLTTEAGTQTKKVVKQ